MDVIRSLYIRFLLAVSCASPTFAQEERLYLSTTNTEWKSSCAGSGPFVMTGVNLSTFNIDGDVSFMLDGQKAWVGYYRRTQFFNLEGCSRIPSTTKKVWMKEISPGHCLSVCKEYNYIGLEDNVCNCISDDNIKQMSLESYACPYTQCHGGILCGNSNGSWIYGTRREDFASSSPQPSIDRAKCITLQKFDHAEWFATECDQNSNPTRVVCLRNDTAVDFDAFNNSRRYAWISAVTLCKDKSEKIADIDVGQYRNIMLKDSRISQFSPAWTSIIVDTVVGKIGYGKNETNPIACGAVLRTNQSANLVFVDCTTRLPAVCVNGLSTAKLSTTRIRSETNIPLINTSSQYTILTDLSTGTTRISITTTEMAKSKTVPAMISLDKTPESSTSSSTSKAPSKTAILLSSTIVLTATTQQQIPRDPSTEMTTVPITETEKTRTTAKQTTRLTTNASTTLKFVSTNATRTRVSMMHSSQRADFPMYGRIGLGILLILVIAVIIVVIQRCKIKRTDMDRNLSHQTSVDPLDNIHTMFNGMTMSDREKKDVRNIEDNETHNTDKNISDDGDLQPDLNYEEINIDGSAQNTYGRQATTTVLIDNGDTRSYGYATVEVTKKCSPKLTETRQVSDSSTYDHISLHK